MEKTSESHSKKNDEDGTSMTLSNEINFVSKSDNFLDSLAMTTSIKKTTSAFKLGGGPLSQMPMVTVEENRF